MWIEKSDKRERSGHPESTNKAANNSRSLDICPVNLRKFKFFTCKSKAWSDTVTGNFF